MEKEEFLKTIKEVLDKILNNNNQWEISIRKGDNGYIITSHEDEIKNEYVVEEKKNKEHFKDICYHILDFFGGNYSKHNKTNIVICTKLGEDVYLKCKCGSEDYEEKFDDIYMISKVFCTECGKEIEIGDED